MAIRTRALRCFTQLALFALVTTFLPQHTADAASPSTAFVRDPLLNQAIGQRQLPLDTPPEPAQASLDVSLAADTLAVGDTTVVTMIVENPTKQPLHNVALQLPLPQGVAASSTPPGATTSATGGWRWSFGTLEAGATQTVTGTLKLTATPDSGAVLVEPEVTQTGQATPVTDRAGALVAGGAGRTTVPFTPGQESQLKSGDGQVTVVVPAASFNRPLTLAHVPAAVQQAQQRAQAGATPPDIAGFKRGFETFYLEATDAAGQDIHQFAGPLTVQVTYTPEQLLARNLNEDALTVFWYDTAKQQWIALPSTVDTSTRTVSAMVNHFSPFKLGDDSSPSEAYMPTVQGWQVSTFTGAATYNYPIDVPAGPSGIKPSVGLSYNSTATDGPQGRREKQQAGWVGLGWSLDTGSVSRQKLTNSETLFSLVLNGQSYQMRRGNALSGIANPDTTNPSHWEWRSTDESFLKVRAFENGLSTASRGGTKSGTAYKRYLWKAWTKDGTRYEFAEDLWWGWQECYMETYKWQLSKVVDTHGNTITYTYGRNSSNPGSVACGTVSGVVDRNSWPTSITWGANPGNPPTVPAIPDRYMVEFQSSYRYLQGMTRAGAYDMEWDGADNQAPGINDAPHETQKLNDIVVKSNTSGSWDVVRRYHFDYDYSLTSDKLLCGPPTSCTAVSAYQKLALKTITPMGAYNGAATPPALPSTTLTYGGFAYDVLGADQYPAGSWNRLTEVNNGYGGKVVFGYENIGKVEVNRLFGNNRRVTQKTISTSGGTTTAQSHQWQYTYGTPNYNTLSARTFYGPGNYRNEPNSAVLYYNRFVNNRPQGENEAWLFYKPLKEFRGHDVVLETLPDGLGQVEHWFHQGNANCIPQLTGGNLDQDDCFKSMRANEFFKGREKRTCVWSGVATIANLIAPCVRSAGGQKLSETEHQFGIASFDYSARPLTGMWHAFAFESQTIDSTYDTYAGVTTPVVKKTRYEYETTYGNLLKLIEQNGDTVVRTTTRDYLTQDNIAANLYIVDRMFAETLFDQNNKLMGITQQWYDTAISSNPAASAAIPGPDVNQLSKGELRLVRRYSNVPYIAKPTDNCYATTRPTMNGTDVHYGYDGYGNQTTVTTYPQYGTRVENTCGVKTFSAPGGNGTGARTTTTEYDPTFRVYPTKATYPSVGGATAMFEQAGYDYRMGTLTSVTDASGNTTTATYDPFNRLLTVVKPGGNPVDTPSFPTLVMEYNDDDAVFTLPFRYGIHWREVAGQAPTRDEFQFYDGLGRKIQVQTESDSADASFPGSDVTVSDSRYNGVGNVVQMSQSRYDDDASGTFKSQGLITADLFRATITKYDGLGRPLIILAPSDDATKPYFKTEHHYGVVTIGSDMFVGDDVVDPNQHRTQYRTDALGRLRQVTEISGDCANRFWQLDYPCGGDYNTKWEIYSYTNYAYDSLDRLTAVVDANTNQTTLAYDTIGRKTSTVDPDMGTWSYTYDANGNLQTQTDAKSQVLTFGYDELDRLKTKQQASTLLASYTYDAGTNGKLQRTGMSVLGVASTDWTFDGRGRKIGAAHNVGGTGRTFGWDYDSADRVKTMTYPSVSGATAEIVTYAYDAGWRQTGITSSLGTPSAYVQNAQYTALDQPDKWTLGTLNNLPVDWTYASTTQRLQQLTVGATGSGIFERSYTYDNGGNVRKISDAVTNDSENYEYDHRDRLTRAYTGAFAMGPASGMGMLAQTAPVNVGMALRGGGSGSGSGTRLLAGAPEAASAQHEAVTALQAPDLAARLLAPIDAASGVQAPATPTMPTTPAPISAPATEQAAATARERYGRLPLAFVANQGQSAAEVRFMARSGGGTMFFTPGEAVLNLPTRDEALTTTEVLTASVVRVRYLGADPNPQIQAGDRLPGVVNYLQGSDPAAWKTNVPTYNGIIYNGLYSGIDLHYEGVDGRLKSTYEVAAGADASRIRWRYAGATDVQVDGATGNLLIDLAIPGKARRSGQMTEQAPTAWQNIGGRRVPVDVRFAVAADRSVRFVLGRYDPAQPLVIDPVLTYSTYLGGTSTDKGQAITVDSAGQAYVTGNALSTNFPTTSGSFQSGRAGNDDVFISKLSADGTQLLYSTYLGGTGADEGTGIALDSAGNIAISGHTSSSNFPTTTGGVDRTFGGTYDAFVVSLTANGSALRYSTYLGGTSEDRGWDIAVASDGRLYVVGTTFGGLPTPVATYDSTYNSGSGDAFVVVINPTLSGAASLRYSTYLGGTNADLGAAIAIDSTGSALVTGRTASTNFPVLNAYQGVKASNQDVFVARLNPAVNGTTSLQYATYVGGASDDEGTGIALTSTGTAVVAGFSTSNDFPARLAYQSTREGDKEGVLFRINPALSGDASLLASTYLGGSDAERDLDVVVDATGAFVLSGYTRSANFPLVTPIRGSLGGGICGGSTPYPCGDAFVMRFDPTTNTPLLSSFLGGSNDDEGQGIAVDASGAIYVTGFTFSTNFPTANPYQGTLNGTATDAFIVKLTQARISMSAATQSVAENVGTAQIGVTLSAAQTYTTTVNYTLTDGTATGGNDYNGVQGTVVLTPNQTFATIGVPIVDDPSDENDETFTVSLNTPTNALLGTTTSTVVTITDNDNGPTVQWSAGNANVNEAQGSGTITVDLSAPSSRTITVNYASSNGSATSGQDYTAASGTLTFAPGETGKPVSIALLNDTVLEGTETLNLTLSAPTNATLGTATAATLTILDDEQVPSGSGEFYNYDLVGNFISKATNAYAYNASVTCAAGTRTLKHAPSTAGTLSMAYDCNGNMTSDTTRSIAWDVENRPSGVVVGSATETYTYDADNERVKIVRTVSGQPTTTIYLEGVWEETTVNSVTTTKTYYSFGGSMVAMRQDNASPTYLQGDHLGSMSVAINQNGTSFSTQRFDPFGEVRSGDVPETTLDYTGQRRDETGLLYYHARYYNPILGRFISPDTVVPGSAGGGMDGIALRPLAVDFHEAGLVSTLNSEGVNADKLHWGGPMNPQALNRYSYVLNNPVNSYDPSGHLGLTIHDNGDVTIHISHEEIDSFTTFLSEGSNAEGGPPGAKALIDALGSMADGVAMAEKIIGERGIDIRLNSNYQFKTATAGTAARQQGIFIEPGAQRSLDYAEDLYIKLRAQLTPEGPRYIRPGSCNVNYPIVTSNIQGPPRAPKPRTPSGFPRTPSSRGR